MFMITYNCRGYNSIKACFIKKLLSQCDVLFIQEHWMLRDKLHLLQNISEEFIVFSKSNIDDGKLLTDRGRRVVQQYLLGNLLNVILLTVILNDTDTDTE